MCMLIVKDFLLHTDYQAGCKGEPCLYRIRKAHLRVMVNSENFTLEYSNFESHLDWDSSVPVSH